MLNMRELGSFVGLFYDKKGAEMEKIKHIRGDFQLVLKIVLIIVAVGVILVAAINCYVKHSTASYIITQDSAATLRDVDAILVLGCFVDNGSPSDMLRDRLDVSIKAYKSGASQKLLMSGDHGQKNYDEVGVMKEYAIKNQVPSEDVFMDHAGFSTYESMYRAKEIFGTKKIVIVTQEYHLYRAVYIARSFGIEAYGVPSDLHTYSGQASRDMREVLARCKDVLYCIFKPEPTFLGEVVNIAGNGDVTNDQSF